MAEEGRRRKSVFRCSVRRARTRAELSQVAARQHVADARARSPCAGWQEDRPGGVASARGGRNGAEHERARARELRIQAPSGPAGCTGVSLWRAGRPHAASPFGGAAAPAHAPGELTGTSGLQEQEAAAKEEEKKNKRRRTTDESSHHTKAVSGTTRCNFAIARSPARRRREHSLHPHPRTPHPPRAGYPDVCARLNQREAKADEGDGGKRRERDSIKASSKVACLPAAHAWETYVYSCSARCRQPDKPRTAC